MFSSLLGGVGVGVGVAIFIHAVILSSSPEMLAGFEPLTDVFGYHFRERSTRTYHLGNTPCRRHII